MDEPTGIIIGLLHHTPLSVADTAICKCYGNTPHTVVEKQQKRIHKVANVSKHASTIEHIVYSFEIDGISRAVLQELARHRLASYTVKSTRYTLKQLRKEDPFIGDPFNPSDLLAVSDDQRTRAEKYIVMTADEDVNLASILALNNLRQLVAAGKPNDVTKYCLPEAYRTSLVWTINARSLQNFLLLRSGPQALWEIQDLANAVYAMVPDDHKFLYTMQENKRGLKDGD